MCPSLLLACQEALMVFLPLGHRFLNNMGKENLLLRTEAEPEAGATAQHMRAVHGVSVLTPKFQFYFQILSSLLDSRGAVHVEVAGRPGNKACCDISETALA